MNDDERRGIFVPKWLWQELKTVSKLNHRTMVGQIREWVEKEYKLIDKQKNEN